MEHGASADGDVTVLPGPPDDVHTITGLAELSTTLLIARGRFSEIREHYLPHEHCYVLRPGDARGYSDRVSDFSTSGTLSLLQLIPVGESYSLIAGGDLSGQLYDHLSGLRNASVFGTRTSSDLPSKQLSTGSRRYVIRQFAGRTWFRCWWNPEMSSFATSNWMHTGWNASSTSRLRRGDKWSATTSLCWR